MRVWVSKFALTRGIIAADELRTFSGFVEISSTRLSNTPIISKAMAHLTRAEAVEKADKMRRAKIATLRKQIAKLEAMEF